LPVEVMRKNATVDWSKRDDVRAKLRLTVKKILMRYGYPPDLAKMEADKVLYYSLNFLHHYHYFNIFKNSTSALSPKINQST
jgi:type I restriction enzyme R subunit